MQCCNHLTSSVIVSKSNSFGIMWYVLLSLAILYIVQDFFACFIKVPISSVINTFIYHNKTYSYLAR